jgi:hypothetical protein
MKENHKISIKYGNGFEASATGWGIVALVIIIIFSAAGRGLGWW